MTSPSVTFKLLGTVVVTGASSGLGHELSRLRINNDVAIVGVDVATAQDSLEIHHCRRCRWTTDIGQRRRSKLIRCTVGFH